MGSIVGVSQVGYPYGTYVGSDQQSYQKTDTTEQKKMEQTKNGNRRKMEVKRVLLWSEQGRRRGSMDCWNKWRVNGGMVKVQMYK